MRRLAKILKSTEITPVKHPGPGEIARRGRG